MSLPSFSQTGVTTMTFSRGDAFPRTPEPPDEGQLVGQSTSGLVRVHTLRNPIQYITMNFADQTLLAEVDWLALEAFLRHDLVKLRSYPFTFTDSDSTIMTVRYWRGLYDFVKVSTIARRGKLVLRIL